MPEARALRFRRIAIAGGSRGLGAALARALAAPDRHLALAARDPDALEDTAVACRAAGAEVTSTCVDLTDPGAAARWIGGLAVTPDLLICAAGIFGGRPARHTPEPEAVARVLIATNLTAALALAEAGAGRMVGRDGARAGRGRACIVLIGSLAARDPLPDARAYSASKAGLACYARALRDDLARTGVQVLLVEPGHLATRQTAQHRGALPFLLTPESAAARILRGLARGQERLAFPRRAVLAVALLNRLPGRLRRALTRDQRFTVDNGPVLGRPDDGAGVATGGGETSAALVAAEDRGGTGPEVRACRD